MLFVFSFSAIMHEYAVACALGFFYPILLFMFGGVGVFFIYLTRNQVRQCARLPLSSVCEGSSTRVSHSQCVRAASLLRVVVSV